MRHFTLPLLILFFAVKSFSQTTQSDSSKTGYYYFKTNDILYIKGYFKDTKRHKIWTWFYADGSLNKQIRYKKGRQLWTVYFEKNKPWLKINRYGKRRVIRACECREN